MNKKNRKICRHFFAENDHRPANDNKEFLEKGTPTTTQYACLLTLSTIGKDGGLVSPENCNPNRKCFVAQKW
jgi:hypothetical protein